MNNVLSNVIKYEIDFKPSPNNLFYALIHA